MIPYDNSFSPPAPVIQATIQNINAPSQRVVVPMQIDTGADLCIIPESIVSVLNLEPEDATPIADYRGDVQSFHIFYVHLRIEQWTTRNVRVIAHGEGIGILGRNVLNQFNLNLRGKEQTFDLVLA
jgi:predicted aspartyl protease